MNTRLLVGVVSFCVLEIGLGLANRYLFAMIGAINRVREDGNFVSDLGFAYPKIRRVFDEYRLKYPNGKFHIYALIAFGAAITGLFGLASALGFFS